MTDHDHSNAEVSPVGASPAVPRSTLLELVALAEIELSRMSTGELTALRRIHQTQYASGAYWKVFTLPAVQRSGYGELHHERPWAELLNAMARASSSGPKARFGQAMARAGVSELRLTRLLSASLCDEQGGLEGRVPLYEQLRSVLSILRSKDVATRFDGAALLLFGAPRDAERVRRGIARDYYRQVHAEA